MKTKFTFAALLVCVLLLVPALLATPAQAADAVPAGLQYSVSGEEVTITDYTGSATKLIIPESINGYPVTSIGSCAFEACTKLTSVTIPDSVTSIVGILHSVVAAG